MGKRRLSFSISLGGKVLSGGKTNKNNNNANNADEAASAALISSEDLLAMRDQKMAMAAEFEKEAEETSTSTLSRAIGTALTPLISNPGDKPRSSGDKDTPRSTGLQKDKLKALYREVDHNNDGSIQPVEMRQFIRNRLKLKAENKEIDAIYEAADPKREGKLDMLRFTGMCQSALEAADEAKGEASELRESASRARTRAQAYEAAASATLLFEEEQAKLEQQPVDLTDGPTNVVLQRRIGGSLQKKGVKMAELIGKWDDAKKGRIGKGEFVKAVGELRVESGHGDVEKLFDILVAGQASDKALGGGGPAKPELDIKKLVKTVFEWVSQAADEAAAKSSQLSALRSNARKLQQACDNQRRQSVEMHELAEQEAIIKAAEKAAAKAAKLAEKEAKKAEKAAKKAEEKAAFEAKVAQRRKEVAMELAAAGAPVPSSAALYSA